MREDEVFIEVHTQASCPPGIVYSKIWSFIHSQNLEMYTDVHSVPGTVPGMENSVIKKKPNSGHIGGGSGKGETDPNHTNKKKMRQGLCRG